MPGDSVPSHFGSFSPGHVHFGRHFPGDVDEMREFLHAKLSRHLAQSNEFLANMILVDRTHAYPLI
jgi:hypothetical protein